MDTKWAVGLVLVLIVALAAVFFLRPKGETTQPSGTADRPLKTFYNEKYGIALNYPDNYKVEEHEATGEGTPHHTIVIADAAALENVPEAGEGPAAITIDIFPNAQQDAEAWVKGSNFSNYKLSPDQTLTPTSVAGEEAVAYGWDGLYRSNSIVFNHKKQIFMLSVGYNAPSDPIVQDFAKVVASIQFDP